VIKCIKCQQAKTTKHTKAPLTITETPLNAFDRVLVDTIGQLPKSERGNKYACTKYLVAIPMPDKSAKTVFRMHSLRTWEQNTRKITKIYVNI